MNYPKQLIRELSEHIDPVIIDFFIHTNKDYDYPVDSIPALIEFIMENSFSGVTSKDQLDKLYSSENHKRERIRLQWFQTLEKDLYIISSDNKTKKLYKDAENWKQNAEALLINFPALNLISSEEIFKSLQSDILISICKYVDEKFDGAINDYFIPFPTALLGIPIFSPTIHTSQFESPFEFFMFVLKDWDNKPESKKSEELIKRTYSQDLIIELSEQLDPKITNFFIQTRIDYNYPVDSILALVELTMENFLSGITSEDGLEKLYFSENYKREQIRQRWLHALEKDLRILSPNDEHYPFHSLYLNSKMFDKSTWNNLYGNITFNELVKKLYKDAENWQQDTETLLINFPALNLISSEEIFKSLQSDVLISICEYIDEEQL